MSDEELHAAFRAFANFGSGSGSTPKSATPKAFELDGARFAKLVRAWGPNDAPACYCITTSLLTTLMSHVPTPLFLCCIKCSSGNQLLDWTLTAIWRTGARQRAAGQPAEHHRRRPRLQPRQAQGTPQPEHPLL